MAPTLYGEGRKRALNWDEDDGGDGGTKRPRFERAFEGLKLDERPPQKQDVIPIVQYEVNDNTGANPFSLANEADNKFSYYSPGTTAYVAERMLSQYHEMMQSRHQLIRPYNSQLLVAYRFQTWVVRMFNRFIRRYNEAHQTRIKPLQSYYKLMVMVEQGQIDFGEMVRIVFEENGIELRRLRLKFDKRPSSDSLDQNCLHYDYWVRNNVEIGDMDMADSEPKIVEIPDTDMDMDVDMD